MPGQFHMLWSMKSEHHIYWATTPQLQKPEPQEPLLCNKTILHNEKPTCCNEEQPPLTMTRERPWAAMKTQHNLNTFFFFQIPLFQILLKLIIKWTHYCGEAYCSKGQEKGLDISIISFTMNFHFIVNPVNLSLYLPHFFISFPLYSVSFRFYFAFHEFPFQWS